MDLCATLRKIPDYPKEGILFIDITTLMKDGKAFQQLIDEMVKSLADKQIDLVVGPEARGFMVGAPLAYALGCGFVPVRKPNKLPAETISHSYSLEYGEAELEMHKDAIQPGQKVVVVDDLLATGGTALAACQLVEELGGEVVAVRFGIELAEIPGYKSLEKYDCRAMLRV